MPTVTETIVTAHAHCQDAQCLGYIQEPVQAGHTHVELSYLDLGGDNPGIERTFDYLRFADDADQSCPHCQKPRAVTDQTRPEYLNLSGHDPMGLFELKGQMKGEIQNLQHARELDEATRGREFAEMRAEIASLRTLLAQQANAPQPPAPAAPVAEEPRRGPGRPPKQ